MSVAPGRLSRARWHIQQPFDFPVELIDVQRSICLHCVKLQSTQFEELTETVIGLQSQDKTHSTLLRARTDQLL